MIPVIPERLPWHRPQWERIERGIHAGRVPHALLLHGAAGNGKAWFAARLAAVLLCRSGEPPCGECESCRFCAAGSHPDRLDVGVEKDRREIVVDQIRDLIHTVGLTARLGGRKVVTVDHAERMNRHAANTLLKTLEDPPGETVFLLVSSNHALLLATIRSRCQMIGFPVADRDVVLEWLHARVGERESRVREENASELRRARKAGRVRHRRDTDGPQADDRVGADAMNRDARRNGAPSQDPAAALDMARGAPIRALELLDGGLLEVRASLNRDLDELLAGGDPIAVAARWKEVGRATVSSWLTDILTERLRGSVLGRDDARRSGSAQAHFSRLLPMLDLCLEVQGGVQARSNANEQLTLERLAIGIAAERPVAAR